ncbi:MAG: hypothetical protein Greene041619_462 [Candidatus Peregrinibacteria bacterium Greene0416_19]|nr:MAG: hypothetical protein Greene041619_462 [Candidatus Peregrinibacteria bacterium Greene0416_19]
MIQVLDQLPADALVPYLTILQERTGLGRPMIDRLLLRTAIVEVMNWCPYDCAMCYINAPGSGKAMPWPHVTELLDHIAGLQRDVLREEAVDVLVWDALHRTAEPCCCVPTPLDAALSLARHRRNRFNNYSGNLMLYWRSNPINWRDPLYGRHFGHIAEHTIETFQLADSEKLAGAAAGDPSMHARFQREFQSDPRKLRDALTLHAAVSTLPFGRGSVGDLAVSYMLENQISTSDHVRISAPHPSLVPAFAAKPEVYWKHLQHTIETRVDPSIVYLFARNLRELEELTTRIGSFSMQSLRPWATESRLAVYEIRKGRAAGSSDEAILMRLRKSLKRLPFIGAAEGRAVEKFPGNPLFSGRGTVMCVNGVVLSPDGDVSYQACTTPEGDEVDAGLIIPDLGKRTQRDIVGIIDRYPLVNRARENVTPDLENIPLNQRRRPVDWFENRREEIRGNREYRRVKREMEGVLEGARRYLKL